MTSVIDLISTPIGERSQSVVMALLGKEKVYTYRNGIRSIVGETEHLNASLNIPQLFLINENVADFILGAIALSGEPMNKLTNYKVLKHTDAFISVVGLDITKLSVSLNNFPKWDLPLVGVLNYMIVKEDFTCV